MIWALIMVVALSTLGNGGDHPTVMILTHGIVAVMLAATALRKRPGDRAVDRRTAWSLAAFFAVATGIAAGAPYAYVAWTAVLEVAVFGAVLWCAARVGPGILPRIVGPLLAAGSLHTGWVLWQRFGSGMHRPAGTFFNTNHLAAWLVAVALLGIAAPAGGARWLRRGASMFLLAAFVFTGSRGALVGLAVGVVVLVVYGWRRIGRRSQVAVAVGIAAIAVASSVLFIERGRSPDPHRFGRARIWESSLRLVSARPWTGIGPGQFRYAASTVQFPDPEPPLRYDRSFSSTHSDWIRVPTETGIVGTIAFVVLIGCVAVAIRRGYRDGILNADHIGAVAAVSALVAQSAFENLSHRPAVYLLAAVLGGGLVSRPSERIAVAGHGRRFAAALTVLFVFALVDVGPYRAWRLQRSIPAGPLEPAAVERIVRAADLNPMQPYIRIRLAEAIASDPTLPPLTRYASAREQAEAAVRLNPLDGSLRQQRARLEAAACRALFPDSAARNQVAWRFLEAEERAPFAPYIPLEASDFLYTTSDFAAAVRAAGRALAIEPDSVGPRLDLARAVLAAGGPGARDRARGLLQQAEMLASEYVDIRRDDEYTRGMLDLDPDKVAWLRHRIDPPGGEP